MSTERTFDWDDAKNASNLVKHGVPFEFAARVFSDVDLVMENTTRPVDGEDRTKAIGMIQGKLYAVVFTMRGNLTRIISARRTQRKEERRYGL